MAQIRPAIGYIRISTGKQQKGTSLIEQQERIETFARERGFEVVEFVTEVKSGGVGDGEVFGWESRPRLQDLLDRAEGDEFVAVIVAKFDRLARDHATQTVLRRMLAQHEVDLFSCAEDNGDGPEAALQRNVLAAVAEYERHLIRERLRRGKAKRKAQGRHTHGRVPYGYRSEGGVLSVDEGEAEIVRQIFAEAKDESSCGRIARRLNRDGVPSPGGKAWSSPTVRRIIVNEVYKGERYGVRDAHKRIVAVRTWNAAQATLEAHRKRAGTKWDAGPTVEDMETDYRDRI